MPVERPIPFGDMQAAIVRGGPAKLLQRIEIRIPSLAPLLPVASGRLGAVVIALDPISTSTPGR